MRVRRDAPCQVVASARRVCPVAVATVACTFVFLQSPVGRRCRILGTPSQGMEIRLLPATYQQNLIVRARTRPGLGRTLAGSEPDCGSRGAAGTSRAAGFGPRARSRTQACP